jgi:hypothetical protein
MESVYHIVTIRVNETSSAHVWRLRSCYLGTGYDMRVHKAVVSWFEMSIPPCDSLGWVMLESNDSS